MKRFKLNSQIISERDPSCFRDKIKITSRMDEASDGEWVRYSEVLDKIEELEARIPEIRIAGLEKALGLVQAGRCPGCGMKTRGYSPPEGTFAPEAYATLREEGIDPTSGHKFTCAHRKR